MESFLKKHGLDVKQNRHNRRFNIIRYYPKIQTYEFINVGIVVYDNNQIFYRLLSEEEISKLHCPALIHSKILKNALNSLDDFLQDRIYLKSALDELSNRYENILDTSFQLVYGGVESSKELVDKLFYDYIGYKLESKEKEDRYKKFIAKTKDIIQKEFKGYLKVKKSKIHGYSLDFLNEKTNQIHHSLLGSIENSENISRAFLNAPAPDAIKRNVYYDFLNTKDKKSQRAFNNVTKLKTLKINVYDYTNDEDIERYCKNLIQKV